jgi:hypothetical protein
LTGRHSSRRRLLLVVASLAFATIIAALAVEVWVRAQWDERRGTPGLFLSDAMRGQRLAAGYRGWFAGVPVAINALGFRDPREYSLDKPPNTFRILMLGDSVTFGHGAIYESTYPYLVEQRLKAWRPDIDWQVWNLGVPGYNTTAELAQLHELGPAYDPDLVVVGFFENDLTDNDRLRDPSRFDRARAAVQRVLQRHVYSLEFYKRVYLTARWHLRGDDFDRQRLDHLGTEEALLNQLDKLADHDLQRVSDVDYFDAAAVESFDCPDVGNGTNESALPSWERTPGFAAWLESVRGFQRLHREGRYRVMFFLNMAPPPCIEYDRFYRGQGTLEFSDDLLRILGDGTPAVSTARAFLHYRPSQMPAASGHSIGNSNRVKADVLFEYLRDHVLQDVRHLR